MAHQCGFTNPIRCAGQGKRTESISLIENSKESIPLCEFTREESTREAQCDSVDAHLGYVEPDDKEHDKKYRAMALKTASKCVDDRKIKCTFECIVLNY